MSIKVIDIIENITRPIIGIENRTAQEVFDIMVARIVASPSPLSISVGDGEASIIECLAAGKPFVFDPATNFLHADDGTVEGGIRYSPAMSGGWSSEEYARGYEDGVKENADDKAWMTDKAWMDAVVMLVHHTENAERTWLVGSEEHARKRDQWWERCKALATTRRADDITAHPAPAEHVVGSVVDLEKQIKDLRHDLASAEGRAKNATSNAEYWRWQYESLSSITPPLEREGRE